MKDGELVEQGTHKELMAKEGEYCKLHSIQAQAFADEVRSSFLPVEYPLRHIISTFRLKTDPPWLES